MYNVTPHVGVWIETRPYCLLFRSSSVTPHVGVWIETHTPMLVALVFVVTPHVGVWIETWRRYTLEATIESHLM